MKMEYESPEFNFQKLQLLERVAAKCWGYAYAWYDADSDGVIDDKEKVQLSTIGLDENGCQGDGARTELTDYFKDNFGIELSKDDVSTNVNTKFSSLVPSNS